MMPAMRWISLQMSFASLAIALEGRSHRPPARQSRLAPREPGGGAP